MNRNLLIISVAAIAIAGGSASATVRHHSVADRYAAPAEPIPYTQLDAYLNGSSRQRAQIVAMASAQQTAEASATAAPSVGQAVNPPAATPDTTTPVAPDSSTAPMTDQPAAPSATPAPPTPQ